MTKVISDCEDGSNNNSVMTIRTDVFFVQFALLISVLFMVYYDFTIFYVHGTVSCSHGLVRFHYLIELIVVPSKADKRLAMELR